MSSFRVFALALFASLFSASFAAENVEYVLPVSERQRKGPGYRARLKRGWRFTWPVKRSKYQAGSAPGPRCFNHCNRVKFWQNHAFVYNTQMSDDFTKYTGKPSRQKWVVTDPFTHNRGQWYGRQPGAFLRENVWTQLKSLRNRGGLHIQAKAYPKDSRGYERVFRRTKARSDKTLEDQGYEEYTMGMVSSKKAVRYGYFEVESRIMATQLVNSFWMSSKINGRFEEIDVYENSHVNAQESQWNVDMRFYSVPNAHASRSRSADVDPGNLITAKPPWYKHWEHIQKRPVTYGMLWAPNRITWFVNGLPFTSTPNKHWNQPMFIRFDVETNFKWHGILPNMWRMSRVPKLYQIYYFRAWGIQFQPRDPLWKVANRQAVEQTVHDIVDEARINGVVRAKKAGTFDTTSRVRVANGVNELEAEWRLAETQSANCTDFDKKDIRGLQVVSEDPSALARHPFKGEVLGKRVGPSYGLSMSQMVRALESTDDYVSLWEYFLYYTGQA